MPKSADCKYCTSWAETAYECSYCGGFYCSDHRLPENHDCAGIDRDDTKRVDKFVKEHKQKEASLTETRTPSRGRDKRQLALLGVIAAVIVGIALAVFLV